MDAGKSLIPICKQMGVSLMPYSSLAAGHLTGPEWNTDTLRNRTDRAAMGKYDRTEEPYLPHRIVGAIDHNPAEGVMLPDEKK